MVEIKVGDLKEMYECLSIGESSPVRKQIRDILLKAGWTCAYIGEERYEWFLIDR
jgi:hypothetical protein